MTNSTKHWIVTLEQNGEDLLLPLPQEILDLEGWVEGDTLEWVDRKDGSWELRRLENNESSNQKDS